MSRVPPLMVVGTWIACTMLVTQYTIRAFKDSADI